MLNENIAPVRLCWLHESAPGRLDCNVELALSPDALPVALRHLDPALRADTIETLASQIAALVGAASGREVHLPYISHPDWTGRDLILAATRFTVSGSRLLPAGWTPRQMNEYHARLAAVAAMQPIDATLESCFRGLHSAVPASGFAAWRATPAERSGRYFHAHRPAAIAMQEALRRALPLAWLSDLSNAAHVPETCAVLAYAATAPFHGVRTQFTHDVLKSGWEKSVLHFARKPLDASLDRLRSDLTAAGLTGIAQAYAAIDGRTALAPKSGNRRYIKRLIANEERIVNTVLAAGAAMRKAEDPRQLASALVKAFASLESKLRVQNFGAHFREGATLLMIEATRAIADYQAALPVAA